jgi:hypothetical protein
MHISLQFLTRGVQIMDADRFDHFARTLTSHASRRVALVGLASGWLAAGSLALRGPQAEAKKKHKKHKKHHLQDPSLNAFGCVDVGQACAGNDSLCCSGTCDGGKPKKGKRDTSLCAAHHTGGCTLATTYCSAGALISKCGASGADARCQTTTGNASFCANVENFIGSAPQCRTCDKDADCEAITGPGSACVVFEGGPNCDSKFACTRRGSSNGTTCLPPGV